MAYVFSDSDVTHQVKGPDGQLRDQLFTNSALRLSENLMEDGCRPCTSLLLIVMRWDNAILN